MTSAEFTFDLTEPQFKANPYPIYERLRAERPVCSVGIGLWYKAWLVTRYDDVALVLRDQRLGKDLRHAPRNGWVGMATVMQWLFGPFIHHMLNADEPDHTRLRGLVQKAFTPRYVEGLRLRIESLCEELLDRVTAQGHMEVMRDYALPLPSTVIAEMLGIPVTDRPRFVRWTNAILDAGMGPRVLTIIPSVRTFLRYIRKLAELRRTDPQDDLLSALVVAEEAGDRLSQNELMAMVFLLLIAGFETTVNLIGNGTLALLDHPAEMERLRTQPSIMGAAIEEMLRYDSPLEVASPRFASCDIEIANTKIRKGDLVLPGIASANRDPDQFAHPDRLDFGREPNRHLAFGQGIHYCLGAALARLEGQIAFSGLLKRCSNLRLNVPRQSLRRRRSVILRGLESLPVAFTQQAAWAAE